MARPACRCRAAAPRAGARCSAASRPIRAPMPSAIGDARRVLAVYGDLASITWANASASGRGARRWRRRRPRARRRPRRVEVRAPARPRGPASRGRLQAVHELRVEPPAAALHVTSMARRGPPRPEDSAHLREADDPRDQRDPRHSGPRAGRRRPSARPARARRSRWRREAERPGESAPRSQRILKRSRSASARGREHQELAHARQELRLDVLERVADLLTIAPVRATSRAWPVVAGAAEQLVHARGVGRAARVLEQERVEEVPTRRPAAAAAPRPAACRSGSCARRDRAAGPR